jgi:2-polyprenyl-3-methyl-5-hydroxy-6-metoxy-1,4-benzoquinol methylase
MLVQYLNRSTTILPCLVCQNTKFQFLFTKNNRDFWRCKVCNFETQHPLPTLSELSQYYNASYEEGMYQEFVEAIDMKKLTAQQRFKDIFKYCEPGCWLDVGSADGTFVACAQAHHLNAEGIELSQVAVKQAREKDRPVYCSTIQDWEPGYSYDTITAFDVLEHVLNPIEFLSSVHQLLLPNGRLVLTLPNQNSLIRKLMGKRWFFYIPEEHLHYFNPSNLRQLLQTLGFEVKKCGWAWKPLTYRYSLGQFKEYNPLIYRLLNSISTFLPQRVLDIPIPLYIGEMMIIAEKKP